MELGGLRDQAPPRTVPGGGDDCHGLDFYRVLCCSFDSLHECFMKEGHQISYNPRSQQNLEMAL